MDQISDDASFKPMVYTVDYLKHLKPTYRLTCNQGERSIILRLEGVNSDHPTCIEWCLPIEIGDQSALIQVLDDGTLKWEGLTYGILRPQLRPQESPHPPASR